MGKLYAALCVATVLLVSLPAICGLDAPAANRRHAQSAKLDGGRDCMPPYLQWENHLGSRAMMRTARLNRLAGEKLDREPGDFRADASAR